MIVMSADRAQALGLKPLVRYVGYATAGYKPEEMGLGPVFAIPKVLKIAGLKLSDIEVIELNEAFAAQSLAVIKEGGPRPVHHQSERGMIAPGHPLGCRAIRNCLEDDNNNIRTNCHRSLVGEPGDDEIAVVVLDLSFKQRLCQSRLHFRLSAWREMRQEPVRESWGPPRVRAHEYS